MYFTDDLRNEALPTSTRQVVVSRYFPRTLHVRTDARSIWYLFFFLLDLTWYIVFHRKRATMMTTTSMRKRCVQTKANVEPSMPKDVAIAFWGICLAQKDPFSEKHVWINATETEEVVFIFPINFILRFIACETIAISSEAWVPKYSLCTPETFSGNSGGIGVPYRTYDVLDHRPGPVLLAAWEYKIHPQLVRLSLRLVVPKLIVCIYVKIARSNSTIMLLGFSFVSRWPVSQSVLSTQSIPLLPCLLGRTN